MVKEYKRLFQQSSIESLMAMLEGNLDFLYFTLQTGGYNSSVTQFFFNH